MNIITQFTVFDAGIGLETSVYSISRSSGHVTGCFLDSSYVLHGFIRDPVGNITLFDHPSAGGAPGEGTCGVGINDAGDVVGCYSPDGFYSYGFIRSAVDGSFATFDSVSGWVTAFGGAWVPNQGFGAINSAGTVAGTFVDSSGYEHGFTGVRTGITVAITVIDVGGPTAHTSVCDINESGAIAGYSFTSGGFFGLPGSLTLFSVSDGGSPPTLYAARAMSINDGGDVAGSIYSGYNQAFVRKADGTFRTFAGFTNIYCVEINNEGLVTGINNSGMSNFGLLSLPDGRSFLAFSVPGYAGDTAPTTNGTRCAGNAGTHGFLANFSPSTALPHGANCNKYGISNYPPGCGVLLGPIK